MKIFVGLIFFTLLACGDQSRRVQAPFDPQNPDPNISQLNQSYTGIDVDGVQRSCQPMDPNINCTTEVTESDLYAIECRNLSYPTIQCGCHDWICLK